MKTFIKLTLFFTFCIIFPEIAQASGTGMPWEGPLQQILNSLTGPVAQALGALAVLATGIGMAMSEGGSSMKKFLMVLFGLSIAFSATTFFLPLFGFAGGATF